MAIAANSIIGGRYRLDQVVGQGGMQQVWAATDKSLERGVAVKVPIVDGAKKRFTQSARLSARVRHSNVASALDYVAEGEGEFYVEELIKGIDLQECMDRHFPRLDGDTAAHVLHHLCRGLAASHGVDVLHRDLKPSNVMVSSDLSFSMIKITDFGIAKLAESEMDKGTAEINAGRTQGLSSTMLGAIPFLAPEVLRKDKPGAPQIGKPSDVWSLAAMGYWLLAGEHPFGTGFEAVPGIFLGQPKAWGENLTANQVTADLVRKLQTIIEGCFKLNPLERPTADELVSQIAQLGYLSGARESGVVTQKGPHGGVWWGRSTTGQGIMLHQAEVMAGAPLSIGARVNYVSTPGQPNRRAVAILRLKDLPGSL
ncbi:serine/threonine-protein kinase [Variovorax guangxiensis]|uniref:non-specific serine/threonine protein kinase n=1 Tax=Variovorax guangxiensis TaxID=1775474 RepID=A0A840G3S4_9BURK|nr:serine/threonine-protein kinase [Variovorax guangxiensis]MBB4223931.1 serine/threonine-protein kinase [Variovorax guangxiensis]